MPRISPVVCRYFRAKGASGDLSFELSADSGKLDHWDPGTAWLSSPMHATAHKNFPLSQTDLHFHQHVSVRVEVDPNANLVRVRRNGHFTFQVVEFVVNPTPTQADFKVVYVVDTEMELRPATVESGALQFDVTVNTAKGKREASLTDTLPHAELVQETSGGLHAGLESTLLADERGLLASISQVLEAELGHPFKGALEDVLNRTPYVLPGGHQLFMRDPKFNKQAQMSVGLSYKI